MIGSLSTGGRARSTSCSRFESARLSASSKEVTPGDSPGPWTLDWTIFHRSPSPSSAWPAGPRMSGLLGTVLFHARGGSFGGESTGGELNAFGPGRSPSIRIRICSARTILAFEMFPELGLVQPHRLHFFAQEHRRLVRIMR